MDYYDYYDIKPHRKFFSRIGFCYFTFFLVAGIFQEIIEVVFTYFFPELLEVYAIKIIISLAPMYFIGAPAGWLVIKKLPAEKPQGEKWNALQIIAGFFMAYGLIYVSNLVGTTIGTAIEQAFPGTQAATNDVQELVFTGNMFVNLIAMVIVGPVVEEILFRKMLCDRLKVYGDGVTMVITGLVFSLFHGNLTQGAYTFVLGMFFAYIYLKTGNLLLTIGYHIAINCMGSILPLIAMKGLDIKEYVEVFGSGDTEVMADYILNNLSSVAVVFAYSMSLMLVAFTGIVLLIVTVARKRVIINPGRIRIPNGKRFSTTILNPGMILYIVLGLITVVLSML